MRRERSVGAPLFSCPQKCGLGRPQIPDLTIHETLKILPPLALWMHQEGPGVGLVKREALIRKLAELYHAHDVPDPDRAARNFPDDIRAQAGLLPERGPREYGFIHLTFEEYLAAIGLAMPGQQSVDPIVRHVLEHLSEAAWREVALLTVGYIGLVQERDEAASAVIEGLLAAANGPPGAAVVLAGEAVADALPEGVTKCCRARTAASRMRVMQDDSHVDPLFRAKAGDALAKLRDPRPFASRYVVTAVCGSAATPRHPRSLCLACRIRNNESLHHRQACNPLKKPSHNAACHDKVIFCLKVI